MIQVDQNLSASLRDGWKRGRREREEPVRRWVVVRASQKAPGLRVMNYVYRHML